MKRPVRVAIAHEKFSLGASVARETVLLVRGLVARGFEVDVYCDPAQRSHDVAGVRFHDVEPRARAGSRLALAIEVATFAAAATRALRQDRHRYDIVHVVSAAAWEHDVIRAHAVMRAEQKRWPERGGRNYRAARTRASLAPLLHPGIAAARTVERLQFRPGRFKRVLAVTEGVRQDLERVHGVPSNLIEVVPCPVDLSRFVPRNGQSTRAALGLSPEDAVLLFVGHDFERKGLSEAIGALAGLPPETHLVVVGGGAPGRYEREAERAGVRARVHFAGPTEDPETFLIEADVFLLPTREDVWGIALIEAMAAGIPSVTTRVAGAAGEVEAAGAGIVVPDGSPVALREAVSSLLSDPARRRNMGERGRRTARAYSLETHVERVVAAFERAVKGEAADSGGNGRRWLARREDPVR